MVKELIYDSTITLNIRHSSYILYPVLATVVVKTIINIPVLRLTNIAAFPLSLRPSRGRGQVGGGAHRRPAARDAPAQHTPVAGGVQLSGGFLPQQPQPRAQGQE